MERIDLTEPARQAMTLLVYGAPGTGKSTLAAQLAGAAERAGKPGILIDTERGLLPAARAEGLTTTTLLSATGPGDGQAILAEGQRQLANPDAGLFVIDTVSELAELILRDASGTADTPQLQHYGTRKAVLQRTTRAVRDAAGCGVTAVVTAQQEAKEVEGLTGHWRPGVPNAVVMDVVAQFDCVARLRVVQDHEADRLNLAAGTRYLDFRGGPQQVAKCRTAAELFGDRGSDWHIWPLRGAEDADKLYSILSRNSAAQEGAANE